MIEIKAVPDSILQTLTAHGQLHLLTGWDTLSPQARRAFCAALERLDYTRLAAPSLSIPLDFARIAPLAAMELPAISQVREACMDTGLTALQNGEVGAVILAGGQGTRLGYAGPKGTCDIGLTRTFTIFEALFDNMRTVAGQCGRPFPVYVMTSEQTHEKTVAFLQEKQYYGYPQERIFFFRQGEEPCTDFAGHFLLEAPGKLAMAPNGNGGWFDSMLRAGLCPQFFRDGVKWLNVFAVDNVLQHICDPVFVGATIRSGCACGAKVVRKNAPEEKVGVLCHRDGHPIIVEYYDMPKELAELREENGALRYRFGVILNYLFRVDLLLQLQQRSMPLHRVAKKIPYLDANGMRVTPQEPNGYKFETLALDLVAEMPSCLPFEVERTREFAPIKNRVGVDSVESAQKLLLQNGFSL